MHSPHNHPIHALSSFALPLTKPLKIPPARPRSYPKSDTIAEWTAATPPRSIRPSSLPTTQSFLCVKYSFLPPLLILPSGIKSPPASRIKTEFRKPVIRHPIGSSRKKLFPPMGTLCAYFFFLLSFSFSFSFYIFFIYTFPSPFSIISSVYYICSPPSWSCWSQLCVGNDTFAFFSWSKTLQISGGDGLSLTSGRGATPDV